MRATSFPWITSSLLIRSRLTLGSPCGLPMAVCLARRHRARLSVAPDLDKVIANLELMPLRLNQSKRATMGERQQAFMKRLGGAGLRH